MDMYYKMRLNASKPYLFTAALFLKTHTYRSTKQLARHLNITMKRASIIFFILGWKQWSQSRKYGTIFCRN